MLLFSRSGQLKKQKNTNALFPGVVLYCRLEGLDARFMFTYRCM